jgi:hypothetical protein
VKLFLEQQLNGISRRIRAVVGGPRIPGHELDEARDRLDGAGRGDGDRGCVEEGALGGTRKEAADVGEVHHPAFRESTPSVPPTLTKAATARSRCSRVWAALSWTRIRAWPFGTTGYEKPTT